RQPNGCLLTPPASNVEDSSRSVHQGSCHDASVARDACFRKLPRHGPENNLPARVRSTHPASPVPPAHPAVIAASNLTRQFGERTAVRDVTFEVGRGEILALLGPNGAGKTTTM